MIVANRIEGHLGVNESLSSREKTSRKSYFCTKAMNRTKERRCVLKVRSGIKIVGKCVEKKSINGLDRK